MSIALVDTDTLRNQLEEKLMREHGQIMAVCAQGKWIRAHFIGAVYRDENHVKVRTTSTLPLAIDLTVLAVEQRGRHWKDAADEAARILAMWLFVDSAL